MRHASLRVLVLCVSLLSTGWAQAQRLTPLPNVRPPIPHLLRKPAVAQIPQLLRRVEPAHLPASATTDVIQSACQGYGGTLGAVCGYVKVPLDREHPKRATIRLYFELYTHTGSGPAESAILVNFGGPGETITGMDWFVLSVFASNLDVHDLLLIDDRGRGFSNTIDCEELQHGTAPFDQATADCATQLGNAASRYGTGDIAQDTQAVRAALGYDKVDYVGTSYGGEDVLAYATRFGEHLRSIVLDSPVGKPLLKEYRFLYERDILRYFSTFFRLYCQRSPTCSPDHPFPEAEWDALVWRVRLSPVEGDAYNLNGQLIHVRFDEKALAYSPENAEQLAAARSLWQGDPKPLLRQGAEEGSPQLDFTDYGDPTFFSIGAYQATGCVDLHVPWDWSAPVSERLAQYAAAVSALPPDYFAPFSSEVATTELFDTGRQCLYWEKPTPSSPVVPPDATYPLAPTLVLVGDMDWSTMLEVGQTAALFPNSTLVTVAEFDHGLIESGSQCAQKLASDFIETLQAGDTSCASTPAIVWPAVGRFPLLAKDARPAEIDPNGNNGIGVAERKVVSVAVGATIDAMYRNYFDYFTSYPSSLDGVGLRAGTFHTDFTNPTFWTTALTNIAFSQDVVVNGTVTWEFSPGSCAYTNVCVGGPLVADLTVSGSGTAGGTLHVEGTWYGPGPAGNFKASGTLGGKQVAVLVPNA